MAYKVLVVDIDDTLLNSNNKISHRNKEAVAKLIESGYHFVLASGRPSISVVEVAKELGLHHHDAYVIAYNGAVIINMATQEVVFTQTLDSQDQRDLIKFLQENDLAVLTYTESEIIIDRENDFTHVEGMLTGAPFRYDAELINNLVEEKLKFIGVGDPKIVKRIEAETGGHFGKSTRLTTSKDYYLEVVHQDVSKGHSIANLVRHLGYSLEEVVAIGDGNNDIQMIEMAGLGVAVANGTSELRAISDEITLSNDEDGVAYIIDKYFLNH